MNRLQPVRIDHTVSDTLAEIKDKVCACIQCGTCTGSCPNAFAMDITPRHLWRMLLMGQKDEIFTSRTFVLCSSCYYCTLRCPRGLPLTEAMSDLKQIAAKEDMIPHRPSTRFYKCFMDSVRRHGRVREAEFISTYFLSMSATDPLLPLKYASMGIRLLQKRKLALKNPLQKMSERSLDVVFKKVEEMENQI
ncbi:4Fe-4S dicluster domain-containing protein [Desulfobacterales bacterium HSG16]|nr:4Fe-4S dicluster domain-containing protein [Desulfobacterales bacterium HSG16]